VHIAVIHRIVLLGAAGHTAAFSGARQAEDIQIRYARAVGYQIPITVIGRGVRRRAEACQRNCRACRWARNSRVQQAKCNGPIAHFVIADRGQHGSTLENVRVDVEKGSLPLHIGAGDIGVVTQCEEHIDGFTAVVSVIGLESSQNLGGFTVVVEFAVIFLILRAGITDDQDMGVAILRRFI
jgi:hypothetical protein